MTKEHLDKLSALMAEIGSDITLKVDPEIKHFFSGAAVYADGRICISLTPAGLALKLPAALRAELIESLHN